MMMMPPSIDRSNPDTDGNDSDDDDGYNDNDDDDDAICYERLSRYT